MSNQLVVFTLDAQQYALPLARVHRVVRIVKITPLPNAPEPVMSMRKRFGFSEPEASLGDQLLVADAGTRIVALVVNSVRGVAERSTEQVTEAAKIVPGVQYVEGITGTGWADAETGRGATFCFTLDGSSQSTQNNMSASERRSRAACANGSRN